MKELIIVTGMSGSGKSVVIEALEDIGFFCIDNLPPTLFPKVVEMMDSEEYSMEQLALGIDIRGRVNFHTLIDEIKKIKQSEEIAFKLLFIDASDEKLVSRYKETRRAHPLDEHQSILEAIREERTLISELRSWASDAVDTTSLTPKELREKVRTRFLNEGSKNFRLTIKSFGFKHGIPIDSDLMFDVRFLPNPHYVDELRPFTGLDKEVKDYIWQWDDTNIFYQKFKDLLEYTLPQFVKEGKSQLVISIGCTGGQHRSVALTEQLAIDLKEKFDYDISTVHRDAEIEGKIR